MILVNGTLEIDDSALKILIPMMRDAMAAAHLEEGCLAYRFSRDLDSPNLVHIVELWESEASLHAHVQAPSFAEMVKSINLHARVISLVPHQGDLREFNLALPQ